MSKLAIQFFSFLGIGTGGIFHCVKSAKFILYSVLRYLCPPPLRPRLKMNSFGATLGYVGLSICSVLGSRANPQVCPSVVQAISVYMIDLFSLRETKQHAVQINIRPITTGPAHIATDIGGIGRLWKNKPYASSHQIGVCVVKKNGFTGNLYLSHGATIPLGWANTMVYGV